MARQKEKVRKPQATGVSSDVSSNASAGVSAENPWPARLTRVAFLLVIVLVCARGAMLEMVREPVVPTPGAEAGARDAGPTTSLVLDLLFCLPAMLVLVRRVVDPTYVIRWSWLHGVLLGLGVWSLASVAWAADRFAAVVGATGFLSALVLLWAMVQLVRSWGRLRLIAGVAFGLLLVYVASGMHYRLVELPRLRADWMENRGEYLRLQGLEPGSFQARQFEQKVLGGDVGRFSSSPNSYAAAVVMLSIVALGVAIQRRANGESIGWVVPIALAVPAVGFVVYHTHSRVAMLTPVLAVGLLGVIAYARPLLAAHSRKLFWVGVGIFALGVVALVGHGMYHGTLPDKSMTFRWYYWTGAAKIVREHPVLGVGFGNFGLYYPAVRGALATEQVKDPHNLFVRFFAELGVVGGVLAIAAVFRLIWELTRPVAPTEGGAVAAHRPLLVVAEIALLAGLLNAAVAIDWEQSSAYITIQLFERAVGVVLLFAGILVVVFRDLREERLEDRAGAWVLYGMVVAVGVFLLHNLIDFSLFETGPMVVFAMLAGAALGVRQPSVAGQRRKSVAAAAALTGLALGWVALAGFVLVPVATAESDLAQGDAAIRRRQFPEAVRHYLAAREAYPSNGDYAFRAAQAMAYDAAPAEQVRELMRAAIAANPREARYYVFLANYDRRQANPDVERVRKSYQEAVALDPRDVGLRLEFAGALEALGDKSGAAEQYREALRQDEQLPVDEPKRLSAERRREVEGKVAALGG